MDFGQLRQDNQQKARLAMYQPVNYGFERRNQKTLILDVEDDGTTNPLSDASEFKVNLFEPLIIDKLSDIYLDSFYTHNSLICDSGNNMAFALDIKEFNINSNVASSTSNNNHIFNKILIPNEHSSTDDVHSCVIHKGKKLNYICSINPTKLTSLSGKITDLLGKSIYSRSEATNSHGKLQYIKLGAALTTFVKAGSNVDFSQDVSATSGNKFITAFDMEKGSVDLYFYNNGGSVNASTPAALNLATVTVNGVSGIATENGTYHLGEHARFIAEFIIIARD